EAYTALHDTFDVNASSAAPNPQALQKIIVDLIDIFSARISSYKTNLPPDPSIDRRPAGWLVTQTGMWKVMTPAQQTQVMNLIAQMLNDAAQAAAAPALPQESFDQLRMLLTESLKAVQVIATATANSTLYGLVAKPLFPAN